MLSYHYGVEDENAGKRKSVMYRLNALSPAVMLLTAIGWIANSHFNDQPILKDVCDGLLTGGAFMAGGSIGFVTGVSMLFGKVAVKFAISAFDHHALAKWSQKDLTSVVNKILPCAAFGSAATYAGIAMHQHQQVINRMLAFN